MSDDMPTTAEVRDYFAHGQFSDVTEPEGVARFNRWLDAHDAEIHREGYSDAICRIYPTADDDAEILDQFMDGYETPTRYQTKDGAL